MKRAVSIFVAGLVVRLTAVAYLAHVKPSMLSWGINEAGGIARWIVTNHSFTSPFHDAHGPTAWLGPIYPLIVAGIFLVFGVQTTAAALAVMVFNSVCSAATGVVAYEIGKGVHSEKAGLFAGWMWVFSPPIAILPFIPWDTSLSALVFSAALLLTLKLQSDDLVRWVACGATWGVAALVNPALLVPLPILAFLLSERGKRWRSVLLMAAVALIVIFPWTVRNYIVFHQFMLVRSNGLAEVYFANVGFETHPLGQSMEYQRMGEGAFTAQANRLAVEYMRTHPRTFLHDSIHRAIWFWIYPINFWPLSVGIDLAALGGLVVLFRNSRPLGLPILAVIAVYPLVYYASQVVSRYRHPIEPVLYALSGIALSGVSLKRGSIASED
jgi:hypothetical protein